MWTLLLLCAAALLAAPKDAKDTPRTQGTDLKVVSFNIRFANPKDGDDVWENRREMVFGLLREQKPDVLALQEALRPQIDELRKALPEYDEVGVGRADGKAEGEHCTILYPRRRFKLEEGGTFWFSDTPEVIGSKSWGNRVVRICTWVRLRERRSGQPFYVYNVHLDHESQPSRERSVQLLLERIRGRKYKDPVLVTGDFNAGENNAAVKALIAGATPAMHDSFRVRHPEEKVVGTFNGFRGVTNGEKIDYVFVSPEFTVEDAQILRTNREGRYPSDHFPVTTSLRLPKPKR